VSPATGGGYVEPGASWRPLAPAAAVLGLLVVLELAGAGFPTPARTLAWALAAGGIAATVAHTLMARRGWTVRVDDRSLTVGRERVALTDVDTAHLRAVREGTAGVDAGAPVLGGGGSLPRGRTGLPLRLADGRTVLVPTRDPAALAGALLAAAPGSGTSQPASPTVPDGRPGNRRTLGP
jgi:hypothetical protein